MCCTMFAETCVSEAGQAMSPEGTDLLAKRIIALFDSGLTDPEQLKRAGLVGADYVHAAEVLDRVQAADDDSFARHRAGSRGERHADSGGQELRRQPDRKRNRKQQRFDHWPADKLIDRQHEENDDDHHPDQEIAELPDAAPELCLGRASLQPRDDCAEGGPAAGFMTVAVCSRPARSTRHVSARRRLSSSTAADARYS